jgi:hypothetical protein
MLAVLSYSLIYIALDCPIYNSTSKMNARHEQTVQYVVLLLNRETLTSSTDVLLILNTRIKDNQRPALVGTIAGTLIYQRIM